MIGFDPCLLCGVERHACLCAPITAPTPPDLERDRRARLTRHELDQLEASESRLEQLERVRSSK